MPPRQGTELAALVLVLEHMEQTWRLALVGRDDLLRLGRGTEVLLELAMGQSVMGTDRGAMMMDTTRTASLSRPDRRFSMPTTAASGDEELRL